MTSVPGPVNLAALDLGTNSFHLVVARLLENGYEVVTLLAKRFTMVDQTFFPLRVPIPNLNFCAGFRFRA